MSAGKAIKVAGGASRVAKPAINTLSGAANWANFVPMLGPALGAIGLGIGTNVFGLGKKPAWLKYHDPIQKLYDPAEAQDIWRMYGGNIAPQTMMTEEGPVQGGSFSLGINDGFPLPDLRGTLWGGEGSRVAGRYNEDLGDFRPELGQNYYIGPTLGRYLKRDQFFDAYGKANPGFEFKALDPSTYANTFGPQQNVFQYTKKDPNTGETKTVKTTTGGGSGDGASQTTGGPTTAAPPVDQSAYVRPSPLTPPSLLTGGGDHLQHRTQIATGALEGESGAYKGPDYMNYYRNLALQDFISPQGNITGTPTNIEREFVNRFVGSPESSSTQDFVDLLLNYTPEGYTGPIDQNQQTGPGRDQVFLPSRGSPRKTTQRPALPLNIGY